jgi:hypothetical protein
MLKEGSNLRTAVPTYLQRSQKPCLARISSVDNVKCVWHDRDILVVLGDQYLCYLEPVMGHSNIELGLIVVVGLTASLWCTYSGFVAIASLLGYEKTKPAAQPKKGTDDELA